nr:EOG090X05T8 [Lepidurus arcticus]
MVTVGRGSYHVSVSSADIISKELDIRGIFRYANGYAKALALLETGQIDVEALISHRFTLQQTKEAFEMALSGQGVKLIRVQSPEGMKRVEINPNDSAQSLFEKLHNVFDLTSYDFGLFKQRNKRDPVVSTRSKTVSQYGLKHGDLIFLEPFSSVKSSDIKPKDSDVKLNTIYAGNVKKTPMQVTGNVQEEEVDLSLQKMDGKIYRKPDSRYCRHGDKSSCIHCLPLEPYDEEYLKEQNIKHMSFHTFLRKVTGGLDKGKFSPLENISCKIKSGCGGHPPWPQAICSKCQPKAITLNRQPYRHVDNVVFENPHLVERFLHYWRCTGHQRIGYLYGRYEVHSEVPLGIKAIVAAIYEPPQESTRDEVKLLPDTREEVVKALASKLGLKRVGWMFTDLVAEDPQKGTVRHLRTSEGHLLSAQECIMAGYFQNMHPNPCRLASEGHFGSKFATVCVTGDAQHHVHMEGYQVSNQCMALVRDGCLIPTKDAPELGYVRESTAEQYVPDVYYKEKDQYGNEVTRLARPSPVLYLLVDVPVSTPLQPVFTFAVNDLKPFPVENRMVEGQLQDLSALEAYWKQFTPDTYLQAVSDFHFLLYIATMDILPLWDSMDPLLDAVRRQDSHQARLWTTSDNWATVQQLLAHHSSDEPMVDISDVNADTLGESSNRMWTCNHCTFMNPLDRDVCEMCTLPK